MMTSGRRRRLALAGRYLADRGSRRQRVDARCPHRRSTRARRRLGAGGGALRRRAARRPAYTRCSISSRCRLRRCSAFARARSAFERGKVEAGSRRPRAARWSASSSCRGRRRPPTVARVSSVARRFGTNWCLLVAPPFVSIVDARASAVRRSVDFALPDALEPTELPVLLAARARVGFRWSARAVSTACVAGAAQLSGSSPRRPAARRRSTRSRALGSAIGAAAPRRDRKRRSTKR